MEQTLTVLALLKLYYIFTLNSDFVGIPLLLLASEITIIYKRKVILECIGKANEHLSTRTHKY